MPRRAAWPVPTMIAVGVAKPSAQGQAISSTATEWASARDTGAWFLLGSIHVRVPGEEQIRNRSYLIDPTGGIVANYDKIHMFDVQLAGGESYRESSTFRPGLSSGPESSGFQFSVV